MVIANDTTPESAPTSFIRPVTVSRAGKFECSRGACAPIGTGSSYTVGQRERGWDGFAYLPVSCHPSWRTHGHCERGFACECSAGKPQPKNVVSVLSIRVASIAHLCIDVICTFINLINTVSRGAAQAAHDIDVSSGVNCRVEDDRSGQSFSHAGVFQSGTGEQVNSSGVSHGCCWKT
jgi:hypothetical protein